MNKKNWRNYEFASEEQYLVDQLKKEEWTSARFSDWYLPNYYHPEEWLRNQEEKNQMMIASGLAKGLFVPTDVKYYWLRANYIRFVYFVWAQMPESRKKYVRHKYPDMEYLVIAEHALSMESFRSYLDQRSFS